MADVRAFPALRYNPRIAGNPAKLIAPPYDVVSPEEAAALYARSTFNIAQVDYGPSRPDDSRDDNRYTRARDAIESWLTMGVLVRDEQPRLYVYDQEFTLGGRRLTRRAIFGRLRLVEWEQRIVLPHEHTRAAAKADRLELLRATRVDLSPIMAMYRSPTSSPLLDEIGVGPARLDATLPGERHVLRPLDGAVADRVQRALASERLYVADGHHRYETALFYRDECRERAGQWTGEEPENFVLAALVDVHDPGLVILPTHRLLKLGAGQGHALARLQPAFAVSDAGEASQSDDIDRLLELMQEAGRKGPSFGAVGLKPGRLHLVTVHDAGLVDQGIPAGHSPAWRRLDVNVLHHVLIPAIGASGEDIDFTDDAHHAAREVLSGQWDAALLLNATPVQQVVDCADAGERMPPKSTYFYPKLATGVVMYPLD